MKKFCSTSNATKWLLPVSGQSKATSVEGKNAHCFFFFWGWGGGGGGGRRLSDRQLIVVVCPWLISHAGCLSHSQKTRRVLLFQVQRGWAGGLKCFYPPVLLVSQNLLQMEKEISAPETDLFAFSSEVVTLTFPVAYVIHPAPGLLVCFPSSLPVLALCRF